jgi:hypothetical protein
VTLLLLGRVAVAIVWLYEGFVCKLVGPSLHQLEVVAAVPGTIGNRAVSVLRGIGVLEVALGLWVLSGRLPMAAAAAQTALLLGMNGAGVLFSRRTLAEPGVMLVKNAAFLVLAWIVAVGP